jgi:Uma2 family endonuclease
MAAIPVLQPDLFSFDDYLALEARNDHKSEFYEGRIVAMAGSTLEHSLLTRNIHFAIQRRIEGGSCDSFNNDIKVYVAAANRGFYPDVSVVCGEVEAYKKQNGVIVNPSLLVEVLSDSTEDYDRTAKFDYYKLLPSFRSYVLVHQKRKCVEVFLKRGDFWTYEACYETQPLIKLELLQISFSIDEVYKGVAMPS